MVDNRFWLHVSTILVIISILLQESGSQVSVHKRFEYKYSFKPPFLAQKDGSVPFWTYGGNAIASSEMVRLAPSLKSQKGAIWTKQPTNFDWWEVDIVFRVSGRGRIGADGLAFWYTTQQGDYNGNVFGSSDPWNGLGIIFDSFDNDNAHNNPYIMAVLNDGTKVFDHQNDGKTNLLAGCLKDFRNKPFPTRARIEYFRNTLTVMFHNGMTNNDQDYEMCLRAENVILPGRGYFGLSAATGGLADDHDVYHFLTTSLHTGDQQAPPPAQPGTGNEQKLAREYEEYQRKLDQQKEEYRKEHPDEKEDMEEWFENDNQRELRQIWQAQSATTEALRELSRKLDEVLGRQERTLGLLSVGGGAQPQIQQHQPQYQQPQAGAQGVVGRAEIDLLLQNQQVISNSIRDLSTVLNDVSQRTVSIANRGTATVQTGGYENQQVLNEVRDGLNQIKMQVSQAGGPQAQVGGCPKQNCLSMTPFLVVVVVQLMILLGYNIYRDTKDAQAKKFY